MCAAAWGVSACVLARLWCGHVNDASGCFVSGEGKPHALTSLRPASNSRTQRVGPRANRSLCGVLLPGCKCHRVEAVVVKGVMGQAEQLLRGTDRLLMVMCACVAALFNRDSQ